MKSFIGRLITRSSLRSSSSSSRLLTKPYAAENVAISTSRRSLYALSSKAHHAFSDFTSLKPSLYISSRLPPSHFGGQKRTMLSIRTQSTPDNPFSIKFYLGDTLDTTMDAIDANSPNACYAVNPSLAKALSGIDGIAHVFSGSNFVTVQLTEDASWRSVNREVLVAICDFYNSGKPLFLDSSTVASKDTAIPEDDSETVAMIKKLLETRIRPALQGDGGDIEYRGFNADTGLVKLKMRGACSGRPSSSVALKPGIENMLMHYVPEVKGVEEELDEDEDRGSPRVVNI